MECDNDKAIIVVLSALYGHTLLNLVFNVKDEEVCENFLDSLGFSAKLKAPPRPSEAVVGHKVKVLLLSNPLGGTAEVKHRGGRLVVGVHSILLYI